MKLRITRSTIDQRLLFFENSMFLLKCGTRSLRNFLLLFLIAMPFLATAQTEKQRWRQHSRQTEIIRDQWGIPHVFGKTDADAVFGMIYAQCEDDFNRVEMNYITAMGRTAEVLGKDQIFTDLRMKLYIDPDTLQQEYANSPAWLKSLMDAWADGINCFLAENPKIKPKLLNRFEPWMALAFSEGSIGGDIERISPAGLKAFYGNQYQSYLPEPEWKLEENPSGSNGFAIAPDLTQNGNALLFINPHTSFYFRPEVHMQSEEGLNAYGAVTWGQFFIYQGFNPFNGWMHTSSRTDVIDHYALTVRAYEGSYQYKHGSQWLPMREKEISLDYADGNSIGSETITAYYSHHGPVIRSEGEHWIAIQLMVEREKALTQSYLRTKTKNHREFQEVMQLRTNSSNNTVYADKDGNIAYYHGNFVPVRNPSYNWAGVVDGSDPDTDWKGLHPIEELVYLFNPENGWIQNCNSTPFTAAGVNSPTRGNYPSYMAPDAENARGLNAVRLLSNQRGFTLNNLIALGYDSYLIAFEPLIPALKSAYDRLEKGDPRKTSLEKPIKQLSDWDLRFGLTSVPMSLAHFWGTALLERARSLERPEEVYLFDFLAQYTSDAMKLEALEEALENLTGDFGTWETPWGEINRFQRLTGDIVHPFDDQQPSIPVPFAPATWGSLASYVGRSSVPTKKIYGTVGNSFVAAVEFGEKVRAKSLLAGGQSGDPSSPHFYDQAEIYAQGEFKEVNFYREDILKHAKKTYRPGMGR
ncbi:penicillin acylase family protein [Lunatimonas sp.]|uniref:penicillin acylase family protein n=1 Tax=Lunatimonas sp. TaxID=2060141 RepID=UPI00344CF170